MPTFSFKYVDDAEATPRTEYNGTVEAEDTIDAALIVMADLYMDGTRAQVYAVKEISA